MSKANFSRTSVIISLCLMLLIVSGLMLNNSYIIKASGSSIRIDKKKSPPIVNKQPGELPNYLLVPILTVPDDEHYTEYSKNDPIQSLGFPIAKLRGTSEIEAQRISIALADNVTFDSEEVISFRILSSIRYEMRNSIIYVSTSLPSPAAMKIPLSFGGDMIVLDNGIEAWLDTRIESQTTPRGINFVVGDVIVTVAGTASEEQLKTLAAQVIVEK